MRTGFILAFTATMLCSVSAFAGNATFTDGRGTWQPTHCPAAPPLPPGLSQNPEARANDVNTEMALRNQFIEEANQYMTCISGEAQADANAASQAIVAAAQAIIRDTQAQVEATTMQMQRPPARY